jgi:5'(3')-deoxyribonucleotidase
MQKRFHVFVDLDGVVADFDGYFKRHHGMLPHDVQKAHRGDDAEMWRMVKSIPNFWFELPLMPGARDLWRVVEPYHPIILTGCPRADDGDGIDSKAVVGKRKWVAHHFGASVPVITCRSKDKPLHMISKGDILIDDRPWNIKKWQKAGGSVVLFRNAAQAISDFKEIVATLEAA